MRRLWCLLALLPALVLGKPDLSQRIGPTVADTGSAYYRFEHFDLDSADGKRHYRVHLGIPKREAPPHGYPALYMLDGNAVLAALREEWLAEADKHGLPLLVMIGYASDLRFDTDARTYDFTPSPHPGVRLFEDDQRRRPAGGAEQFRALIESRIKPQVERLQPVDRERQGLWGHSYGGAFVLDTLFNAPRSFQRYVAVSPSLWWQSGLLLKVEKRLPGDAEARLVILRGSEEARPRAASEMPSARARAMAAVPAEAAREMAERLGGYPHLRVKYRELSDLGHGPMLSASILPALRLFIEE